VDLSRNFSVNYAQDVNMDLISLNLLKNAQLCPLSGG
jgi:hypothetical protein